MTPRFSVRARLLLALAALAAATLIVGGTSWITLRQATEQLDQLHNETLSGVDKALTLSRHAADLATRAPYLLTLQSPFRIEQEAASARELIFGIADNLPLNGDALVGTLNDMDRSVVDLVTATTARAALTDQIQRRNSEAIRIERALVTLSEADSGMESWLAVQRITRALIGAGRAQNLVGVGEYHREFFQQTQRMAAQNDPRVMAELARLRSLADGPNGLFELRRQELARQIEAEAALTRIRRGAQAISQRAAIVTAEAQSAIAAERARTLASITAAKWVILGVGVTSTLVALFAALFVSGYVTANLRAISDAMMRLAIGDRTSRLPRGEHGGDEIGKLLYAFRAFRANTLRLDRSNRQLAQRNALFENLYDGMSDGLAILTEDGQMVARNSRLAEVLKLDSDALEGRPVMTELLSREGWQLQKAADGTAELHHPEGTVIELRESRLATGGSVMLLSDVSKRRELDDRLRQLQRTEALGKIAGEVAHDFGNILSTVTTSLHLLETAPPDRAPTLTQSLTTALDLGTALTQRLLAFARRLHLEPEVMDLNTLVEGMEDLIALALDERITLRVFPADGPLAVRIDPGQMESALLNLCLNAGWAIEDRGEIVIRLGVDGSGRALVEVMDDGCGMSPEVLSHAMEPFFTARGDGTGTGLGLAMVSGFIRQSGGDMRIESEPGKGTHVRLFLPLFEEARSSPLSISGLRVLLVEDDPASAAHACRCLAGNDVTAVTTADDALKRLEHEPHYDLVVTDLHLGGEPVGWKIAGTALQGNGAVRVIVISGRLPATDPLGDRFADRLSRFAKPLEPAALSAVLQSR